MKTIAYQGVKGAFSYLTALKQFGEQNHYRSAQTFKEVFELLRSGEADAAVIPIENSLIGSIYENYDLLNQYGMQIVGEHYTKIEHCLLSYPSNEAKVARLMQIKRVLSHPKALEQCSHFFQRHSWMQAVVHMDTAAAAEEIASRKDACYAAIASAQAGKLYGLDILEEKIEDDPRNYTRFVIAAQKGSFDCQADKCSLLLQLKHMPGALADGLKVFASQGINLTKIESRPLRGSLFEYVFYVDFEFKGRGMRDVEDVLGKLREKVNQLTVLGFYKKGMIWTS